MASTPIITISQGNLLGKTSTNINGETFFSFQGIPYAKPPLGELRFKAPLPPDSWSGTRDATKEGSRCYSRQLFTNEIVGSEDCLFLNVYTPQTKSPVLPVMVWIHGGAYLSGSGDTDIYGPDYLLTQDVVLVTINYRLGILGFLNFEDVSLEIPGNAGLKDMVMALKWVQKNIENFGGNPNNVTIFGESAGASSVHYLMLSPMAKGLFHKAIAQSGCALNTFARGRNISKEISKGLELDTSNERIILQHLLGLSTEKLFELSEKVLQLVTQSNTAGGKRTYAPVIEKISADAFITEDPIAIITSGNYNHVPFMAGYTTREGMLIESKIRPQKPSMPKDFESLIPFTLGVEYGSETSKTVAQKIKDFYYPKEELKDDLDAFYIIHTDNYFLRDIAFAVHHHAVQSRTPVYFYRMSVESSLNLTKKLLKITAPGVCHADDVTYLFKAMVIPPLQPSSIEEKAVRRFVKLWTNFAKYGNPVAETAVLDLPKWKPINDKDLHFIDIGDDLVLGTNPDDERIKFWNNIYKSINPIYAFIN